MTRIDFYVVKDSSPSARLTIACRLAEKAHSHGQGVHVHMTSKVDAQKLDQFMWTFRDGSFLPHALAEDAVNEKHSHHVPIVIGSGQEPLPNAEILINLSPEVPDFFSRMERVMEIVGGDDATRATARKRFTFYRDRGYDLSSHNV